MTNSVKIGMGEMRVRSAPGSIMCLGLGSCVGVVLYDYIWVFRI